MGFDDKLVRAFFGALALIFLAGAFTVILQVIRIATETVNAISAAFP